jgi:uncharacterized protein
LHIPSHASRKTRQETVLIIENRVFTRAARAACFSLAMLIAFLISLDAQKTEAPEPKVVQVDVATLDALVGQYRLEDEPDIVLSFSREGDHLYREAARSPRSELLAAASGTFFRKGASLRYVFLRGSDGKFSQVKMVEGTEEILATRISDQPQHYKFREYSQQDLMIPARDGKKLHAILLRPKSAGDRLPFLMMRTPYGVDGMDSDRLNSRYTELAASGYIFVMADIRGRYKSEGKFQMMPLMDHSDNNAHIDERTDTYDTVEWLLKNVPDNNGRIGVLGISYPGSLAEIAALCGHPAIKAVSPQAPMTDIWMGDDFFHNGAFRQTYGYDYAIGMESSKENTFNKLNNDAYEFFLEHGSFAQATKASGSGELPTWRVFLEHPAYDEFWLKQALQTYMTSVTVPTLEVGGYWDQEDMWGPQEEYATLKPSDKKGEVFLVLGPWNHGQWGATTRHLGDLDFGASTGDALRAQFEAPFFAHYLKDEEGFDLRDTASFQTGTNRWMRYAQWPPKEGIAQRNLYFAASGGLSFEKPANGTNPGFTEYTSDPSDPVPYRKRPIEATYAPSGSHWSTWLAQDQRFLNGRKDIAAWSTPPLDHDLTVTGDVMADLFASTTGSDADWIVKLIDTYPDDAQLGKMAGYQLMVADEIFRGRYRKSFDKPEPIKPGEVDEYHYSLHAADHVFLKGHRIMVQVQSSWFPLYDRNPQKFVPNIMTAASGDYRTAQERIYSTSEYPSHLVLPVAAQ